MTKGVINLAPKCTKERLVYTIDLEGGQSLEAKYFEKRLALSPEQRLALFDPDGNTVVQTKDLRGPYAKFFGLIGETEFLSRQSGNRCRLGLGDFWHFGLEIPPAKKHIIKIRGWGTTDTFSCGVFQMTKKWGKATVFTVAENYDVPLICAVMCWFLAREDLRESSTA